MLQDNQVRLLSSLGNIEVKNRKLYIAPSYQYDIEVKNMSNIEREAEIERGIEAIISKRNIMKHRMNYLQYLKGQKEIKRAKAEEKFVNVELEIRVIDKMINRENAKELGE